MKFGSRVVAGITASFRIRIFTRENEGKLETTILLEPLSGHVQPGDAPGGLLGASWGPPGAILQASWGLPGP